MLVARQGTRLFSAKFSLPYNRTGIPREIVVGFNQGSFMEYYCYNNALVCIVILEIV